MEDPGAAVADAEIELDGEALEIEQRRRQQDRARLASKVAKGGVEISSSPGANAEDGSDERSPLLERRVSDSDGEQERRSPSPAAGMDFSHLPWYRRPSIFWVIGPFFFVACAFGGMITPKMNLILDLVCRNYISERMIGHPGFTMVPVDFNDGDNMQCRIPEVQSRVAMFNLWSSLIAGLLGAITSPKLGALSDRYGRKPILIATSFGTIAGEIVTVFAANYPETFPVPLMLLSFACDGLTGSFITAMSISNAYATDCTPPERRNVVFGYFHASFFSGIAIGPILAGYIVKWSGQISTVFYVMIAVHVAFVLFVAFIVPESLSKKRQILAREKHESLLSVMGPNMDWINQLRHLNILEPLKILRPTGPGSSSALRWNLLVLSAVDTIVFGVAMGSMSVVIIYINIQFGWGTFEAGRFMTIVSSSRVFCLLVLLPTLTRLVRGKPDPSQRQKNTGCDWFDLAIIRVSVFFDTLGFLGYTLSRQGAPFILSGVTAAAGGIGSPTLQAALTKHVPADRTGQLLGAVGLLHALARVVSPVIFNAIYSATVGKFRQTVFLCLCSTFGLAFLISWFIKPGVYYDEDHAKYTDSATEDSSEGPQQGAKERGGRIPIVSAVIAMFGALWVWMTTW